MVCLKLLKEYAARLADFQYQPTDKEGTAAVENNMSCAST